MDNTTNPESSDQRARLEKSERDAKRTEPDNYQADEAASKIVSTGQRTPSDVGSIKSLDNKPDKAS